VVAWKRKRRRRRGTARGAGHVQGEGRGGAGGDGEMGEKKRGRWGANRLVNSTLNASLSGILWFVPIQILQLRVQIRQKKLHSASRSSKYARQHPNNTQEKWSGVKIHVSAGCGLKKNCKIRRKKMFVKD
jgi:hypothetical protein